MLAVSALFGISVWLVVSRTASDAAYRGVRFAFCGWREHGVAWLASTCGLLLLTGCGVIWLQALWAEGQRGEPWVLFEGVSVWPGIVLRATAGTLALVFLVRAWHVLERNSEELDQEFFPDLSDRPAQANAKRLDGRFLAEWLRRSRRVWLREKIRRRQRRGSWRRWREHKSSRDKTKLIDQYNLRRNYKSRASLFARYYRVLPRVFWVMTGSFLLMAVFGTQVAPYRGSVSLVSYWTVSTLAAVFGGVLLFFVADASRLCAEFADDLRCGQGGLRKPVPTGLRKLLGLDEADCAEWLKISALAKRSAVVGNLVYLPFIVAAIWMLSHASVFERWRITPVPALVYIGSLAIALSSAYVLRRSAERARQGTLRYLDDRLLQVRAGGEGPPVAALEHLQRRVQSLQDGAFRPFNQEPALRALLLPFSGVGGAAALDYLAVLKL